MGQANSNSWVRTSTKDDGTKFQTAYRTNTVWNDDLNGIPSPGSFVTNLQVDSVAIDAGITGGGTDATWSTGATRGVGAGGIWSRTFKDLAATDLGFVLPDAGWDDLMDRSSNFQSQVNNNTASSIAKAFSTKGFGVDILRNNPAADVPISRGYLDRRDSDELGSKLGEYIDSATYQYSNISLDTPST